MRVLVTGGGGFLGSAICRLLRARGDEVVSLTRGHYPQLEWLGVRQVAGDIAGTGFHFVLVDPKTVTAGENS